jgi:hypothetical protein
LRFSIKLGPRQTWLGSDGAMRRVYPYALHSRKVEHHAAIWDAVPGGTVSAAADGERQVVLARVMYGGDNVGSRRGLNNHPRAAIDHAIPDMSSCLEVVVAW